MLQNRPTLRTIALAVAICAMSTTVCTTSANAKDSQKQNSCRQNDENKGAVGGNLSYLNVLGKNHYKNHKGSKSVATGFETVGDHYSTASAGHGYKIGKGVASTAKQDSKSSSGTGNIPGLGGFMKGKFDSGSNNSANANFNTTTAASTTTNSNSNSSSGSANAGFGFGLGNLFGGFNGSANGSANVSANGSAIGSSTGSISGSMNGSLTGSSSGSGSVSGSVSGLIPALKPIEETGSNGSSGRTPRVPKFGSTVAPAQVSDLSINSEENVRGRQIDYNEYQQRLARWAATGQSTVTPGGSGTGVIPNPPIRRPFLVEEEEKAKKQKNPGGGGSAGAGAGFAAGTSGLFMEQAWNAMNPKSAMNDASQQRQADPENPTQLYISLPSADRTMQQMFVENIAGQCQSKKNCSGGECSNKGQQGNFDQLKPQEPPQEATSGGVARAQEYNQQLSNQVGNAPNNEANKAKAGMQSQCQGAGEAGAAGSVEGLEQALMVMFMPMSTVNVANEAAGTPGSTLTPFRPLSQAIWMVQKMYKQVFMPMAILLLLPGALILNLKVMIQSGVNHGGDEDTTSPFAAIMRSMIAVFLIPATQLIVSYASDIGSAMTHEVSGATKVMALVAWAKTAMGESMTPLTGEAAGTSQMQAGKAVFAAVMNTVSMTLAYGLLMLIAFQITIMCYLMCMGPIAAAFYVYPTGVGRLFKPVFANWVDAVINIALWKFWWCVIVLCMVTRINLMTFVDINPEWEAYMFVCFLVMMSYVPFCPFECKPGEMVDKILQKAQELKKSAGDQNG